MNLVDMYDALRSKRPYKPSFNHANAVDMISGKGPVIRLEHIDPNLLRTFHRCADRLREIFETHPAL